MKRENEDVDGMMQDIEEFIFSLNQEELAEMLYTFMDEHYTENDIREYFSRYIGEIFQYH